MAIGIGIGLPFRRNIATTPAVPSGLSASFTVDTISGDLTWTDNSGGTAQYEVYSSYNGNPYVYLGTTLAGATSYSDTTCKQNASVVYRIRAKKGGTYSEYATTSVINTPLCWKTDQATRTNVVINSITIADGKTVNVDWGDGTNANYTGANTNVTHTYAASATNIFNVKLSGDTNSITIFQHYNQIKSYGVVTNWVLPSTLTNFYISATGLTGSLPQITEHATNTINYRASSAYMSDSNVTVFRKAMTNFDVSSQNVTFSTANIDKLLKAAADWYQVNAPTANCTYNLSGANMGIPTDGVSNVDIVRLIGYYSAAGFAATVLVRTN
jgi:hypothetical protein